MRRADAPKVPGPGASARPRLDGLGAVPPLPLDDGWAQDRRALPWRALAAPLLGGGLGVLLLATALVATMDRRGGQAERAVVATVSGPVRERDGRGDALVPRHARPVQDRMSFSAPFSQSVNGQDLIRTARFLRVHAGLSPGVAEDVAVPDDLLDEVLRPPGHAAAAADEPLVAGPASEDADVLVSHRALDPDSVPDDGLSPPPVEGSGDADAECGASAMSDSTAADEVRAFGRGEATRFSWLGAGGFGGLSRGLDEAEEVAGRDAFSTMSVQFIPENVTTQSRRPRADTVAERVTVDGSRSLTDLLAARGLASGDAAEAARMLQAAGIGIGRTLDIEAAPVEGSGSLRRIERIAVEAAGLMQPVVARSDAGRFVPVALPAPVAGLVEPDSEDDAAAADGGEPLYRSLYAAIRSAGLAHEAALDLIRLFASDFDLEQGTTRRDSIDILQMEGGDERSGASTLMVQLRAGGTMRRYFRAPDGQAGDLAFVDAEGRSFHASLDTKPVLHARLTSRFGGRYHPILHYTRPHNGIDWAARIGTPIMAAGDGEVTEAGTHSGYGRHVEIRHADGYISTYSHLDRIAGGIVAGRKVARGDVIGYLGQSGLATGPHLHFEFKLNGSFVDPLTVKLPRAHLPLREGGARLAVWVQQVERLSTCTSCEALH